MSIIYFDHSHYLPYKHLHVSLQTPYSPLIPQAQLIVPLFTCVWDHLLQQYTSSLIPKGSELLPVRTAPELYPELQKRISSEQQGL